MQSSRGFFLFFSTFVRINHSNIFIAVSQKLKENKLFEIFHFFLFQWKKNPKPTFTSWTHSFSLHLCTFSMCVLRFNLPNGETFLSLCSDGSYPNDEGSSQEVTQSLFVGESQNRGTTGGQNKYWGLGGVDAKMRTLPRNRWGKGQRRRVQNKWRFFLGMFGRRWILFDKLKLTAWSRRGEGFL